MAPVTLSRLPQPPRASSDSCQRHLRRCATAARDGAVAGDGSGVGGVVLVVGGGVDSRSGGVGLVFVVVGGVGLVVVGGGVVLVVVGGGVVLVVVGGVDSSNGNADMMIQGGTSLLGETDIWLWVQIAIKLFFWLLSLLLSAPAGNELVVLLSVSPPSTSLATYLVQQNSEMQPKIYYL